MRQSLTRRDVYQTITDQIIEELERGVRPWSKPWSADHMAGRVLLPLSHNGIPYRGVNVLALWMAALAKSYRSPIWMTFKQAIDLGGAVRKGDAPALLFTPIPSRVPRRWRPRASKPSPKSTT